MDLYSIVLIAIGLAMDVFSVAAVTGFTLKQVPLRQAVKISLSFGSFHALMPVIGWLIGSTIVEVIAAYDHWVAFLLLAFVGGRMIYGATQEKNVEKINIIKGYNLLLFSVAVSLDALALGLTFYLEKVALVLPLAIIGVIAFFFTLAGLSIGSRTSRFFGKGVEVVGGVILIAIGLRIVLTHMPS